MAAAVGIEDDQVGGGDLDPQPAVTAFRCFLAAVSLLRAFVPVTAELGRRRAGVAGLNPLKAQIRLLVNYSVVGFVIDSRQLFQVGQAVDLELADSGVGMADLGKVEMPGGFSPENFGGGRANSPDS